MAPVWEELGSEYADSSTVLIGNVDCTQQQSVCQDQGVRGYPTLKYFKAGSKEAQVCRLKQCMYNARQHNIAFCMCGFLQTSNAFLAQPGGGFHPNPRL